MFRVTGQPGEFGTQLATGRTTELLGYHPRHSWRDHLTAN
jgi:hypothetical protein